MPRLRLMTVFSSLRYESIEKIRLHIVKDNYAWIITRFYDFTLLLLL